QGDRGLRIAGPDVKPKVRGIGRSLTTRDAQISVGERAVQGAESNRAPIDGQGGRQVPGFSRDREKVVREGDETGKLDAANLGHERRRLDRTEDVLTRDHRGQT